MFSLPRFQAGPSFACATSSFTAPRSVAMAASPDSKPTVLVTGAAGKTGKLIAQKLKASPDYTLRALCRTDQSKSKLQQELSLDDAECVVADVANVDLSSAMTGCHALIVATSATPKIDYWSMPGFLWNKFVMKKRVMPNFTFPQRPEQIDWLGQKAQYDAAKAAGVQHVVVVSSMGGTQPENMLNKIGDGKILMWKRKAEMYLKDSGLTYTIIHPGGLTDKEGGQAPIMFDANDKLLDRKKRSIPRADVAELCIQSLGIDEAKNRSIDCINDGDAPEGAKVQQSKDEFAALFRDMTEDADYSINPPH